MHNVIRFLIVAAGLVSAAAHAQVSVQDPWVRATVPQQKATGAFMQLTSPAAVKFISASSPLTPSVEVHEMAIQGDVMRMRQVQSVDLPAGQAVELKPGGHHIMLLDLKAPLAEGATVPLTLLFKDAAGKSGKIELQVPVRALTSPAAPAGGHGHKH